MCGSSKFAALKTLYAWLYGHPGKKLLFMGSEFAQFIEWDYKKELDWNLLEYGSHAGVQAWVRALNKLYRRNNALFAKDGDWDGFQWLNVEDRKNSVFAFMRADGEKRLVCVYNFSVSGYAKYDIALPGSGKLRLLLSSTDPRFGGTDGQTNSQDDIFPKKTAKARQNELNGLPYSATLTLPGTSALFYDYR